MCMLLMGCGSAGGGFNPLSLNPTLLALPENSFSDNGVTPAVDNDPVYFVNDASSNDNDLTQVTLANRPLYKSAGYWTFDGTNDSMTVGTTSTFNFLHQDKGTVIVVAKCGTSSNPDALLPILGNAGGFDATRTGITLLYDDRSSVPVNNRLNFSVYNNNSFVCSIGAVDDMLTPNVYNIIAVRVDNKNAILASRGQLYINGGIPTANNTSNATASTGNAKHAMQIGDYQTGSFFLNGDIAHIAIIEGLLTDTQLNAYGNYLVAEYPSLSLSWTDI